VTSDQAPAYPRVIEELTPAACHVTEQYANNPVEPIMAPEGPGCGRCAV
jgi:transposase-like protein